MRDRLIGWAVLLVNLGLLILNAYRHSTFVVLAVVGVCGCVFGLEYAAATRELRRVFPRDPERSTPA